MPGPLPTKRARHRHRHRHHHSPPPQGFDEVKPTLDDFETRLLDIQNSGQASSKVSKLATEELWKILQIQHERTRYVYRLYFERRLISRELYLWLLRERYADKLLIAKWKRRGYEKLCCLQCIRSNSDNSVCICRVPRAQLEEEARRKGEGEEVTFKQCVHCGCSGCASTD